MASDNPKAAMCLASIPIPPAELPFHAPPTPSKGTFTLDVRTEGRRAEDSTDRLRERDSDRG